MVSERQTFIELGLVDRESQSSWHEIFEVFLKCPISIGILCTNGTFKHFFSSLSHKVTFKNEKLGTRVKKEIKSHHWLLTKTTTQNTSHFFFWFFFQISLGKIVNIIWADSLTHPGGFPLSPSLF